MSPWPTTLPTAPPRLWRHNALHATRANELSFCYNFGYNFGLIRGWIYYNIVDTMKAIKTIIRPIGNSQGVVIPKLLLAQVGLEGEAELTIEGEALVLRKPSKPVRAGWAEASKKLAGAGDDRLLLDGFSNEGDAEWAW